MIINDYDSKCWGFAKGLDGNDGAEEGIPLRHRLLKKELQGLPGTTAQVGKKFPVIETLTTIVVNSCSQAVPHLIPCNTECQITRLYG